MTTANWITLIVSLVGVATTWGGVQARLKQVEAKNEQMADVVEKIREELQTSRGSQGGRLGVVEEKVAHWIGVLEGSGLLRRKRVPTAAAGVPTVPATAGGNV
ncbi:MAG: hypothetical protein ABIR60_08675 [Allosphingosinicella sp.]